MNRKTSGFAANDDVTAAFLSRLGDEAPTVPPSLERQHVLAAAAAVVQTPRKRERFARPVGRRPLIPRRIPSMSLSALSALFAGLPAKAAAASVLAAATVGGLVATDNIPEPALSALQEAAELAGFDVLPPEEVPPAFAGPEAGELRRSVNSEGVDGPDRAALVRSAQAKDKDEALDHADEASANAGTNNDFGLDTAREGGANADQATAGSGGASTGTSKSAPAREQATQQREQATQTQQDAGSNTATQGTDASSAGSQQSAPAGAGDTADDARTNAGSGP